MNADIVNVLRKERDKLILILVHIIEGSTISRSFTLFFPI